MRRHLQIDRALGVVEAHINLVSVANNPILLFATGCVVEPEAEVNGSGAIFKASGWERLLRDARLGRIHPANGFLTREVVAKSHLGLDLDAEPRWGYACANGKRISTPPWDTAFRSDPTEIRLVS